MLKVGLTGSIAVGKSFVCECFRELGRHVLDADTTAREVVEPGTEGLRKIVDEFGGDVLRPTGELDRKKLATIVFGDEEKRNLLNSIVHPLVIEQQDRWITKCEKLDPNGIAIVDAALMIESGSYKRFDKIIVVWSEPAIQLSRLIERDDLSERDAKMRIASQLSQEKKKRFADHLIDTSRGFEETGPQVLEVFEQLRSSAS